MNAGLCSLQTTLSRGELEHEDVGTLQVIVDYLVLVEVGQARCNLPSQQKCAKTKTTSYHSISPEDGQIPYEVLSWLLDMCRSIGPLLATCNLGRNHTCMQYSDSVDGDFVTCRILYSLYARGIAANRLYLVSSVLQSHWTYPGIHLAILLND